MNETEKMEGLRSAIHDRVLQKLDFTKEISDEKVLEAIDEEIVRYCQEKTLFLSQRKYLRQEIFHSIRKLDILQDLIDDPSITEIMINGTDNIFIERGGRTIQTQLHFSSGEKLEDIVQSIVGSCNKAINAASPIVDARLSNGARVNIVVAPAALNGPVITIRRFPDKPITMQDLLSFGSISAEVADFLRCLVQARYNIFISGGTGSGKTTFLNALSAFIPESTRVITIEDNAELQLQHLQNLVRLEARTANIPGCIPITIRDLIRTSLRMRPDIIIVGEVRGAEALDMLQAAQTGHDGSMSTGHANSAEDMLSRLETMVMMAGMDLPLAAIRGQIAAGIDLIVHLGRLRDRSRKLLEVSEVLGCSGGEIQIQTIYHFEERGEQGGRIIGEWVRENELVHRDKLALAGVSLPEPAQAG